MKDVKIPKKIVISGWYGNKNIGDEAILKSMITSLRDEIKYVDITVFSYDPYYTKEMHNVKAVNQLPITILLLGSIFLKTKSFESVKALWNTDLFILGGGGFLSDWQSWNVVLQWLGQAALAKIFRKKVMVYAIGAGPISTPIGKFITKIVIDNCVDVITVRDQASKNWLLKTKIKKQVYITADPAVLLKSQTKDEKKDLIMRNEAIDSTRCLIGISIPPMFHEEKYWPGQQEKFKRFKHLWPKVIDFICEKLDANVVFIPMQTPSDTNFALEIIKNVTYENKVKVIKGEYEPQQIMELISQMDIMIGMRLHSIILASNTGIPTIGVIYHHKSKCFLKEVGLDKFAVDIGDGSNWLDADIDLEKLIININLVWAERDVIGKEVEKKMDILRKKALLNVEFVKKLLIET